jgi:hypothetical protein
MPDFHLTPEQLGELDKDGGIVSHPSLDIFGNPVDKLNASRKPLTINGKRVLIVIPTGRDSEENTYKLAGDKPAAPKKD